MHVLRQETHRIQLRASLNALISQHTNIGDVEILQSAELFRYTLTKLAALSIWPGSAELQWGTVVHRDTSSAPAEGLAVSLTSPREPCQSAVMCVCVHIYSVCMYCGDMKVLLEL